MPRCQPRLGWLLASLLVLASGPARADSPPDPLRLVPKDVDLVIDVPQPRRLVEAVTTLDLFKELQQFDAVRELYDSTNARRFKQLVAYYEKELGLPAPELLDRLAGGGAVVGVTIGTDPAPVVLVVQSRDEKLLHRFARTALKLLEQELTRQESKEKPEKGTYRKLETVHVGSQFFAAVAGSALVVSNNEAALKRAIDRHLAGGKDGLAGSTDIADARKLLPAEPLLRAWLSLKKIKQFPQAKDIFQLPRNDAVLTVGAGGLLDVVGRSPFVAAGFYREKDGFLLTARLPRGRDGMPAALSTHVPPAGQVGALPLLEPKNVLFSESFWLDVGKFWGNRKQLFNDKQVKTFEDFDKNTAKFLVGNRFSQLVTEMGPHHRIVAANQTTMPYHKQPETRLPAFAYVVSMREPAKFSKAMNGILRGAAFLAGFQLKLKLVQEKHGGCTIVGYRFAEDAPFPRDTTNLRFNFSPCFATVGDQFLACSTIEFGREMVDLLQREQQSHPRGSPAQTVEKVYAAGVVEVLQAFRDRIRTQFVLGQALSPAEARAQTQEFIDLVGRLGVLEANVLYGNHHVEYNTRLKLTKNQPAASATDRQQRTIPVGRTNP